MFSTLSCSLLRQACLTCLAIGLALTTSGCDGDGDNGDAPPPEHLSACDNSAGDPVMIDALSVSGDTLTVSIGHGGGCAIHEFALCWPSQALQESAPPQATLELWHDANGDICEAYITRDLDYDVSALRASLGTNPGTIIINMDGLSVDYVF